MKEEPIAEVGIDDRGRLYIRPSNASFEHIHRAAKEVNWSSHHGQLYTPPPRDWGYERWFFQILTTVRDEYGMELVLTDKTAWLRIPDEIRARICALVE